MLVSGDLALPNLQTPQQFLAQFFNSEFTAEGGGYTGLGDFSEDGKYIVSTLFDTLPGITNGFVELTFASTPVQTTTNAFRDIQSIAIVDNDTGTRMEITLIQPTTFAAFSGEFDVGGGFEGFLDLLMPLTGPGFFLDHDGSNGNDGAQGFATDDFFDLSLGDDHVFGAGGSDAIHGGAGVDTAYYTGAANNYSLTLSAEGATIEDRRADGDGTDTLTSIERVSFQNDTWELGPDFVGAVGGGIDLSLLEPVTGITSEQLDELIEHYSAAHVRLPDAAGLYFFAAELVDGTSMVDVLAQIDASDATPDFFPEGFTTSQSVQLIYTNYLGRAADQAGLDFWTGVVDRGEVPTAEIMRAFSNGVLNPIDYNNGVFNPDGSDAGSLESLQTLDRLFVDQRTDLGALFAVEYGISNTAVAEDIFNLLTRDETGAVTGFQDARDAIDTHLEVAVSPDTGEFLISIVGLSDVLEGM